jgi:hypothetical protein
MTAPLRQLGIGFLAVVALLLLISDPAAAAKRLALVLGNSKYQNVPALENPANDAQDIAASLRQLGFVVIEQSDASRDAMAKAVHDFSDALPGADTALFFYAGHGLQMNGENYLVPVDAKIQNPADVRFSTIDLTDIQQEMEGNGRTSIIILDACRDNPFADKLAQGTRGIRIVHGLVRTETTAPGSLVVYSTQPNNVAIDGDGRNSPFTTALLKNMATPGLEVRQMLSRVRGDVLTATDQKQTPWDSSSLVGDVYLAGGPAGAPSATPVVMPNPAPAVIVPPTTPPIATLAEVENDCDKYAALRLPGVTVGNTPLPSDADWVRIVAACDAEVQAHPGVLRFVYQRGRAEDSMKNYTAALRDYRTVADAGSAEALNDIGVKYDNGQGVLQNHTIAFDDFKKAAAAGSIRALANMAAAYSDGRGVVKDDAKGLDLAERAVEAGNPFGLKIIAAHYFNGAGVPRDYKMAAQYLQQAGDLGNGQALKLLAAMYESGYLGQPDPVKASELRMQAQRVDPNSADQPPLPMLRQTPLASHSPILQRRRYVTYRYNPEWQAAPGDTSCCPNNMLVCPLGRHFCGH